jgi:PqqD family protein of HPr-rel-A system
MWKIVGGASVRFERYDDTVLALNPLSWETHYLREPAASVLECLADGPLDAVELSRRLAESWEDLADEDVQAALTALIDIGLVGA